MSRFKLLMSPYHRIANQRLSCTKYWIRSTIPLNINRRFSDFTVRQDIVMPLGDGKVLKWYKKEGDVVKYDEIYVDVDTEEYSFGMSHDEEEDAVLHKIVALEDDEVREGDVLCVFLKKEGSGEKEIDPEELYGKVVYDSEKDSKKREK